MNEKRVVEKQYPQSKISISISTDGWKPCEEENNDNLFNQTI